MATFKGTKGGSNTQFVAEGFLAFFAEIEKAGMFPSLCRDFDVVREAAGIEMENFDEDDD